jgi:cytidylate kinase-like protein
VIRIVTIDREFGSGGNVIAAAVAERLRWRLWDQLLTDEIARRLDCDSPSVAAVEERPNPTYYRLLRAFMRGSFEGNLNAPWLRPIDTDCVRTIAKEVQLEAAEAGNCVIVGRGSASYLANRQDAFHVFVYAPYRNKVRRLQLSGKSGEEAVALVESVDRDRAAFVKQYFDLEWPGIHRYHLMVNSNIGDAVATETILQAMARYGEAHP